MLILIDGVDLVRVLFLRQVVLRQVVLLYRRPLVALTPLERVLLRRLLRDLLIKLLYLLLLDSCQLMINELLEVVPNMCRNPVLLNLTLLFVDVVAELTNVLL